jgi:long-chain acyl-CoA synthetase
MSLGRMLEESAKRYAKNAATIYDGKVMTYEALNRAVNALGNELKNLGITKGDKVAVMLSNCPEFVISYFAVQKIGAVAVTLNVLSTPYELRHLLGNSDTRCLITETLLAKKFEEIRNDLPLCRHVITTGGLVSDSSPFRHIIEKGPFTLGMPEITGDVVAITTAPAAVINYPGSLRISFSISARVAPTTYIILLMVPHFRETDNTLSKSFIPSSL